MGLVVGLDSLAGKLAYLIGCSILGKAYLAMLGTVLVLFIIAQMFSQISRFDLSSLLMW